MGFWSFIKYMLVFDWLFGHSKEESVWKQRQRECQCYDNHSSLNEYGDSGYSHFHHSDYEPQDFDNDLDSEIFDDNF